MSTQRSMAKGAAWMIGVRVADRMIGFVSLLILARLLTPADFGLVALAFSVLEVIYLLGAFNFDIALIQNQYAEKRHYDTVWTINLLFFCLYGVLLALMAIPAAHFYNDERLVHVMWMLSVGLFIRGFENVYLVDFRKHMRFDQEFTVFLVRRLSGFVVTTILALIYRNYWALIFGTLSGFVITVAYSYRVVDRRPSFTLSAHRELFHFSKWLFVNNATLTLLGKAPDFFIGKLVGAAGLGVFNIAREIASLPSSELIAPINRAAFPGFSKLADNRALLGDAYLNTLGLSLLIAIPTATGIGLLAQVFVDTVLGEQWSQAAVLIRIIAVGGVISLLNGSSGYVFTALGKPRLNTFLFASMVVVLLPSMYLLGRQYGLVGAALAIALNPLVSVPISLGFIWRELGIAPWRVLATAWRPCVACFAMAGALMPFLPGLHGAHHANLVLLFLLPVLGASVFVGSLFVLARLCGSYSPMEKIVLKEVNLRWMRLRKFPVPAEES